MGATIFISHSVEDSDIAEALVDFLRLACDIGKELVFCSSIEGMNTPNGEYFVGDILDNLASSKLVICILTAHYVKSEFCAAEAGIAQFRKKTLKELAQSLFTLVVPPMGYDDIRGGILFGTQSADITDTLKFSGLHERVSAAVGKNSRVVDWNREHKKFEKRLQSGIAKRVVQKRINEQVVIVNVHTHDPASDEVYRNKLRIVMRNDTGKEIKVKQLRWVPDDPKQAGLHEVGDAKKAPHPWSVLMNIDKKGKWLEPALNSFTFPNKHITVLGSHKFLTSVALLPSLTKETLEFLRLNDMLGKLKLTVAFDDVEYLVHKRI